MDEQILQIPSVLDKFESKMNGSVKFVFTTQEMIKPESLTFIMSLLNKVGNLLFTVRQIEATDLVDLPEPDTTKYDKGKTPAQRLRSVIFILHQQKGGSEKDFPAYYDKAMETLIQDVKARLE